MPPKKAATFDWLEKAVIPRLENLAKRDDVANEIIQAIYDLKDVPASLAASSLSLSEAVAMFRLSYDPTYNTIWTLQDNQICDVPNLLKTNLKQLRFVTGGVNNNEAFARAFINHILVSCIAEEKELAETYAAHAIPSSTHESEDSMRPMSPGVNSESILLRFETKLELSVKYKGEKRLVNGFADYSLCYDSIDPMSMNLVLVEAKRANNVHTTAGQLISYMGIVHRVREERRKQKRVVYGIGTDGDSFQFWRIDNDSQLTRSRPLSWIGLDHSQIVSYIRLMIRAAIQSTPSTSPIKHQGQRATISSDRERAQRFDYGVGDLRLEPAVVSADDPDYDVVDV